MCDFNYNTGLLLALILSSFVILAICEDGAQNSEDTFNHELIDTYKIEATDQGIQKVNLKCGADTMHVRLETEKDFSGVMYTRGSFYKQSEPCFVRPKNGRSRSLEMQFSLDQCQTIHEGEVFTNIVVIQNDPELVTPGDSAFSLECDFRKPRNIQVEANMQTRERTAYGSRITLTSPDPSALDPSSLDDLTTVHNKSDTVTYTPDNLEKLESKVEGTVEVVSVDEQQFLFKRPAGQIEAMKYELKKH